ncbi:MAG: regulatory protein RecX [Nocardioidaceae bacterium]
MTSEPTGSPDPWRGDVRAGVEAWAGRAVPEPAPPPDPVAEGPEADHEAVARAILLDQLTGRARSRSELRAKLASRNVPDELAEELLDRFGEVGLVDDAAFARLWVESRQASRGLAPRALAQELRRKGVSDEDARAALEEIDHDAQEEAARALVRKRLRALRGVDTATATRRLVGMLARKGYSSGLAFAVVRDELADAGREPDEPFD